MRRSYNLLLVVGICFLLSANIANARQMYVSSAAPEGSISSVVLIDTTAGTQTTVSSGGLFVQPTDILFDQGRNEIYVLDTGIAEPGGIWVVDPTTGSQSVLTQSGFFSNPRRMNFGVSGDIFVADGDTRSIVRVNPVTGDQTLVSSDGSFMTPVGVVEDSSGDLIVADRREFNVNDGTIFRVDPSDGSQTVISTADLLINPLQTAIDTNGDILVIDQRPGPASIFRIDPVTGDQSLVTSGGLLSHDAKHIRTGLLGDLLVSDLAAKVISVDPTTGDQTLLASDGLLQRVTGAFEIVPEPSGFFLMFGGLVSLLAIVMLRRK